MNAARRGGGLFWLCAREAASGCGLDRRPSALVGLHVARSGAEVSEVERSGAQREEAKSPHHQRDRHRGDAKPASGGRKKKQRLVVPAVMERIIEQSYLANHNCKTRIPHSLGKAHSRHRFTQLRCFFILIRVSPLIRHNAFDAQ